MPDWNAGIAGLRDGIGFGLQIDRHLQAKEDREYQRRRQEQEDAYIRQQRERESAYLTKKRGWEEDEYNYGLQQRKKKETGQAFGQMYDFAEAGDVKGFQRMYKKLRDEYGIEVNSIPHISEMIGNIDGIHSSMQAGDLNGAGQSANKLWKHRINQGLSQEEKDAGYYKEIVGLLPVPNSEQLVFKFGVFDSNGEMVRSGPETNNRRSDDEYVKPFLMKDKLSELIQAKENLQRLKLHAKHYGHEFKKPEAPTLQGYFDKQGREVRGFFNPETGVFQQVGGAKAQTGKTPSVGMLKYQDAKRAALSILPPGSSEALVFQTTQSLLDNESQGITPNDFLSEVSGIYKEKLRAFNLNPKDLTDEVREGLIQSSISEAQNILAATPAQRQGLLGSMGVGRSGEGRNKNIAIQGFKSLDEAFSEIEQDIAAEIQGKGSIGDDEDIQELVSTIRTLGDEIDNIGVDDNRRGYLLQRQSKLNAMLSAVLNQRHPEMKTQTNKPAPPVDMALYSTVSDSSFKNVNPAIQQLMIDELTQQLIDSGAGQNGALKVFSQAERGGNGKLSDDELAESRAATEKWRGILSQQAR